MAILPASLPLLLGVFNFGNTSGTVTIAGEPRTLAVPVDARVCRIGQQQRSV